jgi:hypothetical protein
MLQEEVINAALSQIEDHKNQMDAIMTCASQQQH